MAAQLQSIFRFKRWWGVGFVLLTAASACGAPPAEPPAADIVFVNGVVYTADKADTLAEAAAVADGRILMTGSRDEAMARAGDETEIVDLNGGMLLPGFTDAHAHLVDGGSTLTSLSVHDAENVEEILATVEEYAKAHPELDVIVGSGWALPAFAGGNPDKALLDGVEPSRPVILYAADGHNAWVNSAALTRAGVTAQTPDPDNGRIERDAAGEPSGTLRESAMQLMDALLPPTTVETAVRDLVAGMRFQNAMGYTASIDAAIGPGVLEDAYVAATEQRLSTLRMTLSMLPTTDFTDKNIDATTFDERIGALKARRDHIGAADPAMLKADMVKIFVDGVLENHTGALIEPYVGVAGESRGVLNIAPETLNQYATALDAAGFNIHMHAIGDAAVRAGRDAVEAAQAANPARERQHHMAHIELIDPADIPRFAALGVAANMQTLWAYADSYITDLTEPFIGPERSRWLYPNGALRDAGAFLVSGSDWPVSTSDPFDAIETAVLRMDSDGGDKPWLPEHLLTVIDMLRALTINGAILTGEDAERGSIESGKRADLIVIDADLLTIDPADISEIAVVTTYLDGRTVYTRGIDEDRTP
jgi:hypothetical protein